MTSTDDRSTPHGRTRRVAVRVLGVHALLVLGVLLAVSVSASSGGDVEALSGILAVLVGGLLGTPWWLIDSEVKTYYSWPVLNLTVHAGLWWLVLAWRRRSRRP